MRAGLWVLAMLSVGIVLLPACTGETAIPIQDLPPGGETDVTTPHQLEPTPQMQELAVQQCLDDEDLDQGVVNAVDPADSDQILSSAVVDCDEVRSAEE